MKKHRKSPGLLKTFDREYTHKQAFDYDSMKKRLSNVNKTLYRSELKYDPITLLEKSAITGRPFDKKEPTPRKKIKKITNSLSVLLKSEHKNTKDVKIYQLPKLPFGSHKNYNEENQFIENHFKFDSEKDELSTNLEDLERKFRLSEKNSTKRGKSQKIRIKNKFVMNTDSFKMDSGYLVCKKEQNLVKIYEKNKKAYLEEYPVNDYSDKDKTNDFLATGALLNKSTKTNVVERLYPIRQDLETPLSRFYKTKYSDLFFEEENRPVTSFQLSSFAKWS